MAKNSSVFYTQCKLLNHNKPATTWITISWIPTKFAVIGKMLSLKGEKGWVVKERYDTITYNDLKERSNWYKHWREYTDI